MSRYFLDTSFLLALLSSKDADHPAAARIHRELQGEVFTTEFVLVELGDTMATGHAREVFLTTVERLRLQPNVVILPASSELLDEGLRFFSSRADHDWGLTDCISFVVMQREGIRDALTADRHFEQAGFRALLRPPPAA